MGEVNEEQTETLDGELRFVAVAGKPSCNGCALHGRDEENLPCSAGTRKDGRNGIWLRRTKS
jgi:hypothetical protein